MRVGDKHRRAEAESMVVWLRLGLVALLCAVGCDGSPVGHQDAHALGPRPFSHRVGTDGDPSSNLNANPLVYMMRLYAGVETKPRHASWLEFKEPAVADRSVVLDGVGLLSGNTRGS